jgi:hypothetical protein
MKMTKKILSLLLALLLVPGVCVVAPVTAGAEETGKAIRFVKNGVLDDISGAYNSIIWFGNYRQSSDGNGGFNNDPIKWEILDTVDNSKLFLLSTYNLDLHVYVVNSFPITWEQCNLRFWLNTYITQEQYDLGVPLRSHFMDDAFSLAEIAAIAETEVKNDPDPFYNTPGGNDTTDYVFPLSYNEASLLRFYNASVSRKAQLTEYAADRAVSLGVDSSVASAGQYYKYWLRSPGSNPYKATIITEDGSFSEENTTSGTVAVRPALKLNTNAILFTSAAENGKTGNGALKEIADYNGSDWKMTLLDESRNFSVAQTAVSAMPRERLSMAYTGATVGDNEYISAILTDSEGNAVYYGRLAQPAQTDGTLNFSVPAGISEGNYTLKFFNEQYNGDYKTDYASAFVDIPLTVTYPNTLYLVQNGAVDGVFGAQQTNVWFGNYQQSNSCEFVSPAEPIKWRVLSNSDGRLLLLADQRLDRVPYNTSSGDAVTWETGTLRAWLNNNSNNPYGDSFIGTASSSGEIAVIAETQLQNPDNPVYGTSGGNDTVDKIFLLSVADATNTDYGFTDANTRVASSTAYAGTGGHNGPGVYIVVTIDGSPGPSWWLRTPGGSSDSVAYVDSKGGVRCDGYPENNIYNLVRPALNVDLNSVLFTSAATGGKPGGGELTRIDKRSTPEWKLTLLDENRDFTVSQTEVSAMPGKTVSLTYSGASVGNKEYVSVILADTDGKALYYGRLAQPTEANGTVSFTVPEDLPEGSYTLKAFSEQYNGDYKTDYASAFADVTLKAGADGERITGVAIDENGHLIISFANGGVSDLGKVTGENGSDGQDGQNGQDGQDGNDGEDGITPQLKIGDDNYWYVSYDNGTNWECLNIKATGENGHDGTNGSNGHDGNDGQDGVGIKDVKIDEDGNLIVTLTNDREFNLGKITGENGANGSDGTDGQNGADGKTPSLRINAETLEWEVSYDDGATWTSLGIKATGEAGQNGNDGQNGADGKDGEDGKDAPTITGMHYNDNGELIVTMSDGTEINAGKPSGSDETEKPVVTISGYEASRSVDYGTQITFHASADSIPDGCEIHFFLNGEDQGSSDTLTVNATGNFNVCAKLMKGDSTLSESKTEKVTVKSDFFSRIIAFFKKLFNANAFIIDQK